mmetsp:Transcript_17165/g.56197  ORF Transcript_17165/g.56197 Transcript_17165/m.56197 type:complete len:200 (-) Transcript_17165:269-868(-)
MGGGVFCLFVCGDSSSLARALGARPGGAVREAVVVVDRHRPPRVDAARVEGPAHVRRELHLLLERPAHLLHALLDARVVRRLPLRLLPRPLHLLLDVGEEALRLAEPRAQRLHHRVELPRAQVARLRVVHLEAPRPLVQLPLHEPRRHALVDEQVLERAHVVHLERLHQVLVRQHLRRRRERHHRQLLQLELLCCAQRG